jgi:starch phosphorylase
LTEKTYEERNPKRLYYLSMEFLIGRSLTNNVMNLLLTPMASQVISDKKLNLLEICEQEPDAGLGNGGLGRLAACFMESAATLHLPAMGYGLRYEYGIFGPLIHGKWLVRMNGLKSSWAARSNSAEAVCGPCPAAHQP